MNLFSMKKWMLGLALTLGSFLTLPAYAWPEVDHMNMCGSATKAVQSYAGGWKGWAQYDRYVAQRGKAYYLRANCPKIVAPVKKANYAPVKKKAVKKSYRNSGTKRLRIAKSSKAKSFKRSVKYDEHADCARVDRMNGYGAAVLAKGRVHRPVANMSYKARPAKRRYNYFKNR